VKKEKVLNMPSWLKSFMNTDAINCGMKDKGKRDSGIALNSTVQFRACYFDSL
jgi:hypothetical protein